MSLVRWKRSWPFVSLVGFMLPIVRISESPPIIYNIERTESGGERGIRTPDTLLGYSRSPGVRFKPLSHLSTKTHCRQPDRNFQFKNLARAPADNSDGASVPRANLKLWTAATRRRLKAWTCPRTPRSSAREDARPTTMDASRGFTRTKPHSRNCTATWRPSSARPITLSRSK